MDGKTDRWDVSKYIADFEELEKMKAEETTRVEELASFGVMTTHNLVADDSLFLCSSSLLGDDYVFLVVV